jgi:hypothetical protein
MIINFKITRIVNASKDVALWNTWDHEHLYYVHKQFGDSKIIFENKNLAVIHTKMKIPFLPISFNSIHTLINLNDNNVKVIDTMPFGVIADVLMEYIPVTKNRTKLINHYKITAPTIFFPIKKFIPFFIKKWNKTNWNEDMPLKLRRMKAISLGFRDFHGIPKKNISRESYRFSLPIPRLKDSILNL